jgi:hypothetical protein
VEALSNMEAKEEPPLGVENAADKLSDDDMFASSMSSDEKHEQAMHLYLELTSDDDLFNY